MLAAQIKNLPQKQWYAQQVINTNNSSGYSKKLEIATPLDIRLLTSLSDITPSIKLRSKYNIKKHTICQIAISSAGDIRVGYGLPNLFTSYYTVEDFTKFVEGINFEFI